MEGKFNKHSSDTLNMEWKDNKHSYVKDKNKEHSKDAETVEQKYDKGSIVKDKGNNSSSDTLSVEEKDNIFLRLIGKKRVQVSPKSSIYFKDISQYHRIGLNLILYGQKKSS